MDLASPPWVDVRCPGPMHVSQRSSHRGSRSAASRNRRGGRINSSTPNHPHGAGSCESEPTAPFSPFHFSILHANVQGYRSHLAEVEARLSLMEPPGILCFNETFLNNATDSLDISNYTLLGRRDRCDGREGGGIAVFARSDVFHSMVFIQVSDCFERMWYIIHTDIGPILTCCWYRPPCHGECESIRSLWTEWELLAPKAVGTIIIGDINVHHTRWL